MICAKHLILSPCTLAAIAGTVASVLMSYPGTGVSAASNDEKTSIVLPKPRQDSKTSVEEALLRRRSVRSYSDEPLSLADISQLLWAAQGITEPQRGFRTAPSAGGLLPLEVHVFTKGNSELPAGIYRYVPKGHSLTRVAGGDKRRELSDVSLGQACIADAPVSLVITAVPERTTGKYGQRGIRYIDIEAGHAAQNVCLQAVALGLETCMVGAFIDEDVKKLMGLPENEVPVYLVTVGKPKGEGNR